MDEVRSWLEKMVVRRRGLVAGWKGAELLLRVLRGRMGGLSELAVERLEGGAFVMGLLKSFFLRVHH